MQMNASLPVDLLTGKIISFIENEVSLLGGVRDQLEDIKLELLTIKAFLADAGRKGALTLVEKTWIENLRDVSIDVEDIIEDFTYHINKQRSWGPLTRAFRQTICLPKNLWEKHQLAIKLQKTVKTINSISRRIKRYGVERIEGVTSDRSYDPNWIRIHGQSSLFFKDDELVGIKDAKEKLLGWLLSGQPQRTVISVVGMGGSGKTTLVANTFKSQAIKKHFDCHAWITVSQNYRLEDLLRLMVTELYRGAKTDIPQDLSSMSYMHLVDILAEFLQPRKYVIVLDDVWDMKVWTEIIVALPTEHHGSRVMLTTRNKDIASSSFGAGSQTHNIQPLPEKAALDLFSMKAFSSWPHSCCPPEFEGITRDLVGKCKGLPLGIAALGALMSTKNLVSEWRKIYSSLNWHLSNNPKLDVLKSILLLSFNGLLNQHKHCFLYFSIFPEDYEVQCKRLIRLLMAEGFVEHVHGTKPEDIAESYIAELTNRCMLQIVEREPSGRAKKLKMHDLLRELALSISETEKFCSVYSEQVPTNQEGRVSRRLSIQGSIPAELLARRDLSKVSTFFIFASEMATSSSSSARLPSSFKQSRVLDFKDVPIVQLPDELVKCFNLKYLNLRGTKVKKLPEAIGELHNLETLDIRHSEITTLPTGVGKLKNLRHLLMFRYNWEDYKHFDFYKGTRAPFDVSKLKNLQVLDAVEVEGGELFKQLQNMTQLTTLCLTNVRGTDGMDLCQSIERMKLIELLLVRASNEDEVLCLDTLPSAPPLLNTLLLHGKLERAPHWFDSLQSLTSLNMHSSRLTDDLLPSMETLPNLTSLWLSNVYVGNELVFRTGFRKLSELRLINFPQLNMITIARGVMPPLQRLVIRDCMESKTCSFSMLPMWS